MLPAWSDMVGIICRLKNATLPVTLEGMCLNILLAALDEQRSPVWCVWGCDVVVDFACEVNSECR